MKKRIGSIFVCLSVILFLQKNVVFADFDDFVDTPKPTELPTATPVPPTISAPISHDTSTNVVVPKKEDGLQKSKDTGDSVHKPPVGHKSKANVSSGGGDLLSGNLFGSVEHDTAAPVSWKSDSGYASRDKGVFILTGHVNVTQDNLVFTSDSMDIVLSPTTKKPERIVAKNKAVARKEVNKKNDDYIEAKAQQMNYDLATGMFTLTTNARITRGKNCDIKGDILYYDMQNGSINGKQISGSCVPPTGQ